MLLAASFRVVRAVEVLLDHRRLHVPGADAIAPEAVGGVVDHDRLGEAEDAGLHGRVRRQVPVAGKGEDGAEVHDRAAALLGPHCLHRVLTAPERAGEAGRDEIVPLLVGRLVQTSLAEDARVVDEEVKSSELGSAALDCCHDVFLAAHVPLLKERATRSCRSRFVCGSSARFGVSRQAHDVGALSAKGQQDLASQAA
jgi:hypothetical protein